MTKKKSFLPVLIVAVGILILFLFIKFRPHPPKLKVKAEGPLVSVEIVRIKNRPIIVTGSGTVRPEHAVSLTPQVSGKIVSVSPNFVTGGFFKKGELLLGIEKNDYQIALKRAKAQLLARDVEYQKAMRQAKIAKKDWDSVMATILKDPSLVPDQLTLYIPQLKAAKAALSSAKADVELAELNLARTDIRAPFNGRLLTKEADIGQFVTMGKPVANIFSTDVLDVVVPLTAGDAALFDIPCKAEVESNFGQTTHRYTAKAVRTEGELDPASRMVHVVVQVAHPFSFRVPLENGAYVNVRFTGRRVESVRLTPRVVRDNKVWIVKNKKLRILPVHIIYRTDDAVFVTGVPDKAAVITSTLFAVSDGMRVRILKDKNK
ncbi:MAG: efflux RND transporter periplasmic adaptor subunit [Acidobacteria bacterium]|nr:efflux RND transporter periplasmic adaptor subunit [Acidobacteriota bacterium]